MKKIKRLFRKNSRDEPLLDRYGPTLSSLLQDLQALHQPLDLCYPNSKVSHFQLYLPVALGFDKDEVAIFTLPKDDHRSLKAKLYIHLEETNSDIVTLKGKSKRKNGIKVVIIRTDVPKDRLFLPRRETFEAQIQIGPSRADVPRVIHGEFL